MEFVTIHELSRQFDIPSRVVRYRLLKLIAEGKLKEGEDFRREEFKDEQHFLWKINPLSFMRETGLQRVAPPPKIEIPVNQTGNNQANVDNHLGNEIRRTINPASGSANQIDNKIPPSVNQPAQSVNTVVTKPDDEAKARAEDRAFEREMIGFLKEQIKVKDEQFREQGKHLKDANELNLKLNSTLLQQGQKIETLLRLTGGKMEMADMAAKAGGTEPMPDLRSESDTNQSEMKQAA